MNALMIQGTASSVGKSLLTAGLCRLYARRGVSVAPFKSQNMSNQAAVAADGGELGRAQAVQAQAAGLAPHVDMNPILLKPESQLHSQVVVHGRPLASMTFRAYQSRRTELIAAIRASLSRLQKNYELVLIEGAGSPAEINLRDRDLVNMWVAREAKAPVLLVGNIDPGGVFAQLVGTLALLSEDDRARVAGLVINQLRGDPTLLTPGLRELEELTDKKCLGVVPMLPNHGLEEEDGVGRRRGRRATPEELEIAVLAFPHLSNFDDLRGFEEEPDVVLRVIDNARETFGADLVVLPGSKRTRDDLAWLRKQGFAEALQERAQRGEPIVGICGGCQMLGERIDDPLGVEGPPGSVEGLGLLPGGTRFAPDKRTRQVKRHVAGLRDLAIDAPDDAFAGYEIHHGRFESTGPTAFVGPAGERDGSVQGSVFGTMTHGLLAQPTLRGAICTGLAARRGRQRRPTAAADPAARFDRLADHLEAHLDIAFLDRLVNHEQ